MKNKLAIILLLRIDNLRKTKKTIKIAFDGFLYIFKTLAYANKSKTKDGNIPKTIFNTIATTATA
jgi:hypothetical protein